MSFMSWLFGGEDTKEADPKKKEQKEKKREDSTKSLIERLKDEVNLSIDEPNGDTQRFIKAELDAAREADEKRVEQTKETNEKVEEHRKRADTVMRKVAEKTCGLSDILVKKKDGKYVKPKPLTEKEQEEAKERGLEIMRKMGWRES
jgi:hypothetical protein